MTTSNTAQLKKPMTDGRDPESRLERCRLEGEPVTHIFVRGQNSLVNDGRVSFTVGGGLSINGIGSTTIVAAFREADGVRLFLQNGATLGESFFPNEVIMMSANIPDGRGLSPVAA